jgi:hypothetical protein
MNIPTGEGHRPKLTSLTFALNVMSTRMKTYRLSPKVRRPLLIIVLVISGVVCVMASIAWSSCATDPGSKQVSIPASPLTDIRNSPAARTPYFRENIDFLKAGNVPVSDVYASFGPPDWESKPLRLIAYRARNNQVLFVSYGTNNVVTYHAVRKLKANDSLQEIAPLWLRST